MQPKFIHDCEHCKFIGHIVIPLNNEPADVYLSCDGRNITFRYSDHGPDYSCVAFDNMPIYFKPAQ